MTTGTAFVWDGHIWFVLSNPRKNSGKVLCANLTTLDEECPDDECPLAHPDYAWIQPNHKTTVAFSRAKVWEVSKIEKAIAAGIIKQPTPNTIPSVTISKIIQRAKSSRELSPEKRAML